MVAWAALGVCPALAQGAGPARAQDPAPQTTGSAIQRARNAITTTDYLEAIDILTSEIESKPSPEAYLYLGLAHANLDQHDRALEIFDAGRELYPGDSRFLAETAGVHLARRNTRRAQEALAEALEVNPRDGYAADLLASLRMSEGEVREALDIWNGVDQPRIESTLQNFSPGFLDRVVPGAAAFEPGDLLTYARWKTTEERMFATRVYANVGLEIEPARVDERYNAIVRTTARKTTRMSILWDLFRETPFEETHLSFHDIGGSAIGWRSSFRWDKDRRRLSGLAIFPLPLPGVPVLEIYDTWRSERWDVFEVLLPDPTPYGWLFDYRSNALGATIEAVPDYRFGVRFGFEYRNRDATGRLDSLDLDSRNTATIHGGVTFRPVDSRFRSQVRLDGFIARESILGDFDFSGGTVQLANRVEFGDRRRAAFNFSVTGGTARGDMPFDHYFILGLGSVATHDLRAHVASDQGHYGRAPMGTGFLLLNTDFERRLMTLPLFGAAGIPFIEVHGIAFYDTARVFDRRRVFRQDETYHDFGAGLRFRTPTGTFTILYGRDAAAGNDILYGFVERALW
jgi:hypothetical protein